MPRHPKPTELRQNIERVDVGEVPAAPPPADLEVPPPLRSWLRVTKSSWDRYWRSPAQHIVVATLDLDGLERLWTLYDERERGQRELRKARVVIGSQGQERQSGFYTVINRLDAEIRQLEDRFGKSARSRLILGMRVGGRADTGDDKPDQPGADAGDGHDDAPARDPRLYVLDGKAG